MQSTLIESSGIAARGCFTRSASDPRRSAARRQGAAVVVRAQQGVKPPQGVTLPPIKPEVPPPKFGFVDNAERINSRAAMLGFFALLILEAVVNKGLLELLGISTGGGLGA